MKDKKLPNFPKIKVNKETLRKSIKMSKEAFAQVNAHVKPALDQVKPALAQVGPVSGKVIKESVDFSVEITGKIKGKLKEEKLRRRAKIYLSIICVIAIILAAAYHFTWNYLSEPGKYPIKQVEVMGTYQNVKASDIQTALTPYIQNGLFGMSEVNAEAALEQIPGVEDASIWRIYPDEVRVIVREKAAIAVLNNLLLSADGCMFPAGNPEEMQNLPQLRGDPQYVKQMLAMLESITPVFNEAKLNVTGFGLLSNGDWQVEVNHQTWITLGKNDLVNRVTNFLNIYPTLMANAPSGQIPVDIDLRYPHGFAVVWGTPS